MRIVVLVFLQSKSQFLNQYGSNFEPVDGKCYLVSIQMKAVETEQYFHGLSCGTGSFAAVQGVFNRMPGSLSISWMKLLIVTVQTQNESCRAVVSSCDTVRFTPHCKVFRFSNMGCVPGSWLTLRKKRHVTGRCDKRNWLTYSWGTRCFTNWQTTNRGKIVYKNLLLPWPASDVINRVQELHFWRPFVFATFHVSLIIMQDFLCF